MDVNVPRDGEKLEYNRGGTWWGELPRNDALCGPDNGGHSCELEGARRCPESGLNVAAGARDTGIFQGMTEPLRLFLSVVMDFTRENSKCPAGQG